MLGPYLDLVLSIIDAMMASATFLRNFCMLFEQPIFNMPFLFFKIVVVSMELLDNLIGI